MNKQDILTFVNFLIDASDNDTQKQVRDKVSDLKNYLDKTKILDEETSLYLDTVIKCVPELIKVKGLLGEIDLNVLEATKPNVRGRVIKSRIRQDEYGGNMSSYYSSSSCGGGGTSSSRC